jgi:ABC-type nitrate/sulfonate/bicarbonate transport system substrate-binding protein
LAQAITQNIIDGGYLGYAYGAQLERQGYRMLGDLMKMGIPYQGLGMIAKRSLIDRTPEIPERTLRAMVEAIAYVNNPANKSAVVKTLTRELRLSKIEDAQAGYEMMRTLYDKKFTRTLTVCGMWCGCSEKLANPSVSSRSKTS